MLLEPQSDIIPAQSDSLFLMFCGNSLDFKTSHNLVPVPRGQGGVSILINNQYSVPLLLLPATPLLLLLLGSAPGLFRFSLLSL